MRDDVQNDLPAHIVNGEGSDRDCIGISEAPGARRQVLHTPCLVFEIQR